MEPAISINRQGNYDRITASAMAAILKLRKQEYEVQSGMTVRDAILRHDIEPEVVIPTRDGELIADDEVIHDGETIRLVPVISGGYAQRTP
jgi:sulfur carrier protein ThiS